MSAAPHHPWVLRGYHDAQNGLTSCPEGLPAICKLWAQGYDLASENGEALFPRFGKLKRTRHA